ncbi:MAG: heme-binding protein [Rhodanobacteraceae bacterium]
MATEEAQYSVVLKEQNFELRHYAPQIVAETVVDGDFDGAGNKAFGRLFKYISGDNQAREKVAMTAPVGQQAASEKINMTAPVAQQRENGRWVVSFMMPASFTMQTIPQPRDPQVSLRRIPARDMAAVRYTGFWSEKAYLRHRDELLAWIEQKGFSVAGEPVWARYNPPFMPWFLRRNEILVPVMKPRDGE